MSVWKVEKDARIQGSRALDNAKVQAPCIVRAPEGGYRLFYTGVGPGKPFRDCQGYILSAVSEDGLKFEPEPGIRVAPNPEIPYRSLRVLAPSVTAVPGGGWRMYFEARGSAGQPTVICSAFSKDQFHWEVEEGIRLSNAGSLGGPRYTRLPGGRGRIFCFNSIAGHHKVDGFGSASTLVISASTTNGLDFTFDPGHHLRDKTSYLDSAGITAAEVIPPANAGDLWVMYFSAWQDVPPGTIVPVHPSLDTNAVGNGSSADFAAASIAADMSGYRSRILRACSKDGMNWITADVAIEGGGYDADGIDAVHAEDMSLIELEDGRCRMYYAACDKAGNWRVASAVADRCRF